MQKKNSRKVFAGMTAALLAVSFMIPSLSFAEEGKGKDFGRFEIKRVFPNWKTTSTTSTLPRPKLADDSDMRFGSFCAQIEKVNSKIDVQIAERETKLLKHREESNRKFELRKVEVNEKVFERRIAWDGNFGKRFSMLESRADTQAKKDAVARFRTAVETAAKERRAVVDSILSSFRANASSSIAARQAKIDEIIRTYKAAVSTAAAKAKADCALQNADSQAIKKAYKESLKVAREKFEADRKEVEKIRVTVNELTAEKKAELKKANADFKVKVEAALKELKAAFPEA